MKTGITLITMGQANPIALKRTVDSVQEVCDEVVFGDLYLFSEDRTETQKDSRVIMIPFEFNFIYKNGFSAVLNSLAEKSTNDWVLYLNVGEVIEKGKDGILSKISSKYNCYYLDHATEHHRWFRLYNKKEMKWSGLIHEEIVGEHRPYKSPIFTFADTEKDIQNPFKAKVANDFKECVYWRQLMRIVDEPESLGATSEGWVEFAKNNYQTMVDRLAQKGIRPKAIANGDYKLYMMDVYSNPEFEKERFDSNHIIEFQGDPMYLGKKQQ